MKNLRVGLIGAGGISGVHAAAWTTIGAELHVYSLSGAEHLAEEYGAQIASSEWELFDAVDVVDIVTPSATHKALALAAISAGKHVVCEKPLGLSVDDAMAIVDAARGAGIQLYPAHVVRFFPEYARVKREVDADNLGKLAVLRFSRAGEAPPKDSWFFSERDSGGLVFDQMIHDLDQARWIGGEVTQIYALQNPATADGVVPSIVTAHVVLTHSSGAISHVQGVWGPPGLTFRTSLDVAGTGGLLRFDSSADGSISLDLPSARGVEGYLPTQQYLENPYTAQIREFAAAFKGGPPPRVTMLDAVMAVAIAEAAAESIRTGLAVDFDSAGLLRELHERKAVV